MCKKFLNNTFFITITNFVFINFIVRNVSSEEEKRIYVFNIKQVNLIKQVNFLRFVLSAALQFFLLTDMRNI